MNPTSPSNTSTRALYISNWQNLIGIWKAGPLTQTDPIPSGPRLSELHYLRGSLSARSANQIVDYTGFFRDETNQIKYNRIENFTAEGCFQSGTSDAGILTTNYLSYKDVSTQPQLQISRSYAAPPNQPFLVVRYSLTNPTSKTITFNVLDMVHLHNLDPSKNVNAWYDLADQVLIADMTASGQLFVYLGALQSVDGFQAGNDAQTSSSDPSVSGWCSFDANGTLMNHRSITAPDVDLSFNKHVTVNPKQTQSIYFYLGVAETQAGVDLAAASARSKSGDNWFAYTAGCYNTWLTNGNLGRRVHFDDDGLNQSFDRALIVIKNAQNPVTGAFAATTNPFTYGYKDWVRDSCITSIALDASGHHDEAEQHFRWLADRQGNDGSWKTTYSLWDSSYVPFVEPEYDSVGAFLYGVYRHYALTADTRFLGDLWPTVKKAADWIVSNIQENGFGQSDYSIWEEEFAGLEYNAYTQAWYVAGLYAIQSLAEAIGDTSLTEWYAGGAASILTAIQRPSTWNPPGLWNPSGYYNRAVNADDSVQPMLDSSSDMLIALNVVDCHSGRAASHIAKILNTCTKQTYGLMRYRGDVFYHSAVWDPAGDEALATEPSWPQMSLWVAIYEASTGKSQDALSRMQWYVSVSGKGYMPPGEAVSNVSRQPLISTMCEPLTAAAFVLTALVYEGQYSLAIVPPSYNAGTFKNLTVTAGAVNDAAEWNNVPYFLGPRSAAGLPMCQIKRVYAANDGQNLYLRVENVAGSFSKFAEAPLFALRVYSQDMGDGNATTTSLGTFGQPLPRPMSFIVERESNSNDFQRGHVSGGVWTVDGDVTGAIAPQWDTASGSIEAVIPLAFFSEGAPRFGDNWADVLVALDSFDTTMNAWSQTDSMLLHYRLSTPEENWVLGNLEPLVESREFAQTFNLPEQQVRVSNP